MDMIEVDPKLFVTCRLCLENLGHYQIVPSVQQQIKFCYDIDVEPFDGLPQLICMTCKNSLGNFFTTKKTLCEKQNNLRKKMCIQEIKNSICIQPQQDTVSSSQQPSESKEGKENNTTKNDIELPEAESSPSFKSKRKKQSSQHKLKSVLAGFKQQFVCTICNKAWSNMESLSRHQSIHTNLKTMFPAIFNNNCLVSLEKFDEKPNITGMNDMVMHDNNKIIKNCNSSYYIKYSREKVCDKSAEQSYNNNSKPVTDSESTDTEDDAVVRRKRRKRRISSASSNDTVVVESNSNKVLSDYEEFKKKTADCNDLLSANVIDNQCINIDSSDSETDKLEPIQKAKQPMEANLNDYKIIQGIISMCVNAYHRKYEKSDKQLSIESQLKRKVLSIGRKVINKQGFNCTGLLRYLEHKDLDIVWVTKAVSIKDTNYVRIMTKLRGPEAVNDDMGWVPVGKPSTVSVAEPDSSASKQQLSIPIIENVTSADLKPNMDSAILLVCNSQDSRSKLLNANPVANPKQLPRKAVLPSESKATKPTPTETFQNNEHNDHNMPIITSATSLAAPAIIQQYQMGNSPPLLLAAQKSNSPPLAPAPAATTAGPRIKVKPDSELMSKTVLERKEQSVSVNISENTSINGIVVNNFENKNQLVLNQTVWSPPNVPGVYIPTIVPQIAGQPVQLVQLSCLNMTPLNKYQPIAPTPTAPTPTAPTPTPSTNNKDEFVLLHTTELPNTKTASPFTYLRSLLQTHNLILFNTFLSPFDPVFKKFVCLIKFKVQFTQEPIDEPVVLCLSLFSFKNKFCFIVKDHQQHDIDLNKISPNWQWEILNVFRGDLVDKVLLNAQKHSQETHDYTYKFLCLLKSIQVKKCN